MSLKALRKLPSSTAKATLARAIDALLASGPGQSESLDLLPDLEKAAVLELAQRTGKTLVNASIADWRRMINLASDELTQLTIGLPDKDESARHLGRLGLLPPSRYRAEINQLARDGLPFHGLTEADVRLTIKSPDAYQHLSELDGTSDDEPKLPLSLFARILNRPAIGHPDSDLEWCLALVQRHENKAILVGTLRPGLSDLKSSGDLSTPFSLWKASVISYGLDVIIRGKNLGKILNATFTNLDVAGVMDLMAGHYKDKKQTVYCLGIYRTVTFPQLETTIQMGWILDDEKYTQSLNDRGIRSTGKFIG